MTSVLHYATLRAVHSERSRRQEGLLDTVWTRLSQLGLVPSASSASRVTRARRDGRNADGTVGNGNDTAQAGFSTFASSEEELTSAMERLVTVSASSREAWLLFVFGFW